MFTTQFNVKRTRREHSTQKSLVSKVPCTSNKELIAQALLTGTLVQASNVGYDFTDDEKIADYMFDVDNQRKMDITERFEFASYVRQKVDGYIKGKLNEKTNSLETEVHQKSKETISDETNPEGQV